jgi:hypothetical protein
MAALVEHGMLLESARGPLPNVASMIVGEPIKGSWWGHPAGHEIFAGLNELADSPDVVRVRLVNKKITLIHRRLWPAVVRLGDHFPAGSLDAVVEEHTPSGTHRAVRVPYPSWVPEDVLEAARAISFEDALAALPEAARSMVQAES